VYVEENGDSWNIGGAHHARVAVSRREKSVASPPDTPAGAGVTVACATVSADEKWKREEAVEVDAAAGTLFDDEEGRGRTTDAEGRMAVSLWMPATALLLAEGEEEGGSGRTTDAEVRMRVSFGSTEALEEETTFGLAVIAAAAAPRVTVTS
jgi:hypothetical protein